jgi:hypothetical protein
MGVTVATQTKVELIDDLTGDKADETVLFGIDGREFEIDLSRDHAGELRDNLARYLAKARKVGKFTAVSPTAKRPPNGQRQSREQTAAIREWARANGQKISDRGRIPLEVAKAFEDAHRGPAAVG